MQFMPRKQRGKRGREKQGGSQKIIQKCLQAIYEVKGACGNCAHVFVCDCVCLYKCVNIFKCVCEFRCVSVCMCAKGLLVFADLLTRWVMLFGFCHCIHLGAHVRRRRSGESGGRRWALWVAYVCQRVFGRVHVCVLMFINA